MEAVVWGPVFLDQENIKFSIQGLQGTIWLPTTVPFAMGIGAEYFQTGFYQILAGFYNNTSFLTLNL
jgi:hypothetical protein